MKKVALVVVIGSALLIGLYLYDKTFFADDPPIWTKCKSGQLVLHPELCPPE